MSISPSPDCSVCTNCSSRVSGVDVTPLCCQDDVGAAITIISVTIRQEVMDFIIPARSKHVILLNKEPELVNVLLNLSDRKEIYDSNKVYMATFTQSVLQTKHYRLGSLKLKDKTKTGRDDVNWETKIRKKMRKWENLKNMLNRW